MPVGKVMKHHEKGTYGWILSQEDGKSIFFHMNNLNPKADELPPVDTLVEFDVSLVCAESLQVFFVLLTILCRFRPTARGEFKP